MTYRVAITVRGIVQGVGFRPFVFNLATREQLAGWVLNESDAVRMEVQGSEDVVQRFLDALQREAPVQACIDELDVRVVAPQDLEDTSNQRFQIRTSQGESAPSPTIPADLATCDECLAEIRNPRERRYRYPFTNCTNCGPRWSIITALPYDRSRTSMSGFSMCDRCRAEYEDPTDRRFHAQPIACPDCGPTLRLITPDGKTEATGDPALRQAAERVKRGEILAVRGLGGFQLVALACCQETVARLRRRKRRPDKPFAVMLADLAMVGGYCLVPDEVQQLLAAPQAPIVLLQRLSSPLLPEVAESVAPGNPCLGVMLPYTPLHHLLMAAVDQPIICTSGNRSEEPMAISTEDALTRLSDIADVILTHDRPVVRPVDDSVVRVVRGGLQVIRRARGYAPHPIRLVGGREAAKADGREGTASPSLRPANSAGVRQAGGNDRRPLPPVLALGGHLKNTVAINLDTNIVISPHIGDLDNRLSVEAHQQAVTDLMSFFRFSPELIACDLHPDYQSTLVGERLARERDLPLIRIQHHHAHVLSVIAEHGLSGPVLGLAWDGTGYGTDGTVWGGEVLLCEGSRFSRAAHLRQFALPGGDRAVREPRRTALGLLYEIYGDDCRSYLGDWFEASTLATFLEALQRRSLFPRCSSMGRLFDAVAACCGFDQACSFEGQAAIALEHAADWSESGEYVFSLDSHRSPVVIDWRSAIEQLRGDLVAATPVPLVSARFHNGLARLAAEIVDRIGVPQVALTGGCFQNRLLLDRVTSRLSESGVAVYTQRRVPPGDGGIALGQLFGATLQVGE
jgi:hydrogenase maturation protein HypF